MLLLPCCVQSLRPRQRHPRAACTRTLRSAPPLTRGPNSPQGPLPSSSASAGGSNSADSARRTARGGAGPAWARWAQIRSGVGSVALGGWSGSPGNPTEHGAPHLDACGNAWSSDRGSTGSSQGRRYLIYSPSRLARCWNMGTPAGILYQHRCRKAPRPHRPLPARHPSALLISSR